MPYTQSLLDELDYRILQQLSQDARRSASDIARAVGAQERTVRNRIERLLSLGAVRMAAVVNPNFFGYTLSVDIFLAVDPAQEPTAIDCLLNMPAISYLAYGEGAFEISVEARFQGAAEMHDFLRRTLPGIPGITVKSYALVPRILRNIDQWMPKPEDFGLPGRDQRECNES